jgi:hypothetical protein
MSAFRPAWWLRSRHLQTLYPSFLRRRPALPLTAERLELPDGDFIDLAWTADHGGPLCLLLHGLEGNLNSHYARGLLRALHSAGMTAVFLHFRGCSGEPNRLRRRYHSGDTGDLAAVLAHLRQRCPGRPLTAVGISLGGNVLLKYLGERGADTPLHAAVAVSVPFDLANAARTLNRGFARIYQRHLVQGLARAVGDKHAARGEAEVAAAARQARTLHDFDDRVTAPLHDFAGADDYYLRSSSRQYLGGIAIPTRLIHAADDPFMTAAALPDAAALPPAVQFDLQAHGGHVGFIGGRWPWCPRYWLDNTIPPWLLAQLRRR